MGLRSHNKASTHSDYLFTLYFQLYVCFFKDPHTNTWSQTFIFDLTNDTWMKETQCNRLKWFDQNKNKLLTGTADHCEGEI